MKMGLAPSAKPITVVQFRRNQHDLGSSLISEANKRASRDVSQAKPIIARPLSALIQCASVVQPTATRMSWHTDPPINSSTPAVSPRCTTCLNGKRAFVEIRMDTRNSREVEQWIFSKKAKSRGKRIAQLALAELYAHTKSIAPSSILRFSRPNHACTWLVNGSRTSHIVRHLDSIRTREAISFPPMTALLGVQICGPDSIHLRRFPTTHILAMVNESIRFCAVVQIEIPPVSSTNC